MESSKHTKSDTLIFGAFCEVFFISVTSLNINYLVLPMCIFPFLFVQICVPHFSQKIRAKGGTAGALLAGTEGDFNARVIDKSRSLHWHK